jgi:hypothetical protein
MRWLAALLLLAGCGSKSDNADGGGEGTPPAVDVGLEGAPTLSPAQMQARAEMLVGAIAKDPRFADLKAGPLNSVCGKVDSKQPNGKYGGFTPFLITPEGVAVVSATPRIMFEDPADPFPDLYIRWCATPEEMQAIGPAIARVAEVVPPPVELPPETIDPVPEGNWGVVPGAAPPPAPKAIEAPPAAAKEKAPPPAPAMKPQPGDEDSFLKSVVRPQEPKSGN